MIQKDTVGDFFECSKLSRAELLGAVGTAVAVFFLASVPTIIRHLQLTQAQTLLLDKTEHAITSFLAVLDSFSFTNTVVTFLFWGFIGIIIYGLTTALVRLWQAGEEEKELISDEYVHPAGFSKKQFWRQIIEKEAFSAALLGGELIVLSAVIFWAFPFALMRVGAALGHASATEFLMISLWTAVLASLFSLGLLILKAWRYRHILFIV